MLNENMLNAIKEGKKVSRSHIPGYVVTPVIPDIVFDKEFTKTGEEFKRTINVDYFINFLENVARANTSPAADISLKSIQNSTFYRQCVIARNDMSRNNNRGFVWLINGKAYSVALDAIQATSMNKALTSVIDTSVVPNIDTTNPFANREVVDRVNDGM